MSQTEEKEELPKIEVIEEQKKDEIVDVVSGCQQIIRQGKRKGVRCGKNLCKKSDSFCSPHFNKKEETKSPVQVKEILKEKPKKMVTIKEEETDEPEETDEEEVKEEIKPKKKPRVTKKVVEVVKSESESESESESVDEEISFESEQFSEDGSESSEYSESEDEEEYTVQRIQKTMTTQKSPKMKKSNPISIPKTPKSRQPREPAPRKLTKKEEKILRIAEKGGRMTFRESRQPKAEEQTGRGGDWGGAWRDPALVGFNRSDDEIRRASRSLRYT
jgi:hypothetical protein